MQTPRPEGKKLVHRARGLCMQQAEVVVSQQPPSTSSMSPVGWVSQFIVRSLFRRPKVVMPGLARLLD